MTEKKIGTVNPVAIRELISQGLPMKRKESKMKTSQTEEPSVSLKSQDNEPITKDLVKIQKREKRVAAKDDYESLSFPDKG